MSDEDIDPEEDMEGADPSVPTELLELHVLLEGEGVTPEEFSHFVGDPE